MDRESARELLAPYALGALPEEEARALQQALLEWPEGRAELAQLIAVADALPVALTEERPPLGLEGRIIAKARQRRRPFRSLMIGRRPKRAALRFLPYLLTVGFAAAVAVLAVMHFVEIGSEGVPSGGRWIDLAGTDSATAYVTYAGGRPIGIVFRSLDPPPEDRIYQLHRLRSDGVRVSDVRFLPRDDGWAAVALVLPADEMLVGFGITVEPIEKDDPDPSSEFPPITFPAR